MDIQVIASGSKGNCYKVENKNTTLLIECGIPLKEIRKALNFGVSSVDGCLITHEHGDHAYAVKDLLNWGVDCYMTKGTATALKINHHRLNLFTKKITHDECASDYDSIRIGSFQVLPFRTIHDVAEPVGFMITDLCTQERLLFITDTSYVEYLFPSIQYLMVECNYIKEKLDANVYGGFIDSSLRNRIVFNHMNLETLESMIQDNEFKELKEVYVLHLSDTNSDEKEIKERIQKATGVPVYVC